MPETAPANEPIWIVVEGGVAQPYDFADYGRVVILDFDNMEQDPAYAAEVATDPNVPAALREQAREYVPADDRDRLGTTLPDVDAGE